MKKRKSKSTKGANQSDIPEMSNRARTILQHEIVRSNDDGDFFIRRQDGKFAYLKNFMPIHPQQKKVEEFLTKDLQLQINLLTVMFMGHHQFYFLMKYQNDKKVNDYKDYLFFEDLVIKLKKEIIELHKTEKYFIKSFLD